MRIGFFVTVIFLVGQSAFAQLGVQQPVVGVTSVQTTVSVPDRGTTFIGGVSSAQSGRSQYGPLRSGTSTGLSRQSTSISTRVHIIDLNEMDQAILNSRPMTEESARPGTDKLGMRRIRETGTGTVEVVSPAEKIAKFEELARRAEKAGKMVVAKCHWQIAAKYGSKVAENRLAELALPAAVPSTQSASR